MIGGKRAAEVVGLVVPYAAGIGTAIALWGDHAPRIFFATAAEVIALGAVAMALEGRLFRISGVSSSRKGIARATILISAGTGLGFAFAALAREDGGAASHLPLTAGALAMGAAGVAIQALFGYDEGDRTD